MANEVIKGWIIAIGNWLHNFFNPKLEGYTNFDFGSGEMLNVRIVIFGIFGGALLAALYTIYVKNVIGAFVRKLLTEGCLSKEKAKTLEELGFLKNVFVRSALKGSLLASTVVHVTSVAEGEETSTVPERDRSKESPESAAHKTQTARENSVKSKRQEIETTRFYIKEEKKYVAEMRFHARGSGWPTFFFVLLVSVMCIFLIFSFLPQILRFLDNTISIFSVAGNTLK